MALISKKKIPFKILDTLKSYLLKYGRFLEIPIHYRDLARYDTTVPLYDSKGDDTFWETVFFKQSEMAEIHESLKKLYALLKADGDLSVMQHLNVDRIDLCTYGNTQPFRIRIVNQINDNFDYFYVKYADASRVYGLEFEHLLSPNRISYLVNKETLIEEHIIGIPGDVFIKNNLKEDRINKIRLAKEFVKFNERCFVRLLGDMHANNFVVDVTPDFEEVSYRLRAIDFDQQSYEGRRNIYLPQYFKQNNPLIALGLRHMTPETVRQYRREERSLIAHRIRAENDRIEDLLKAMKKEKLSSPKNVKRLGKELAEYYGESDFLECTSMGAIVHLSLKMVIEKPNLYDDDFMSSKSSQA